MAHQAKQAGPILSNIMHSCRKLAHVYCSHTPAYCLKFQYITEGGCLIGHHSCVISIHLVSYHLYLRWMFSRSCKLRNVRHEIPINSRLSVNLYTYNTQIVTFLFNGGGSSQTPKLSDMFCAN